MLPGKDDHGVVEHQDVVHAAFLGAFSLVMDDPGPGIVIIPVTCLHQAVGEVYVFPVHEELLIQQSRLVQGLPPHKHESAGKHIHLVCFIVIKITQVIAAECLRFWEKRRKSEYLAEGYPRSRQPTLRLWQETSLSVKHLHAQPPGIRMRLHERHHLGQRVILHDGIRIQQEHILSGSLPDGLVVGLAETHVFVVGNQPDLGKLFPDHVRGSIYRLIVDHEHLHVKVLSGPEHRMQALLQEIPDVIVYNDDGKLHLTRI